MLVFGHNYFGLVDQVPGLFYVMTRFVHIWWLPLVPWESWVIADDGQHSHRIPLSWKSVFVDWSRFALGFLFVFLGLMLLPIFTADPKKMTAPPFVAAGLVVCVMVAVAGVYSLTYRWARPRRPCAPVGKVDECRPE